MTWRRDISKDCNWFARPVVHIAHRRLAHSSCCDREPRRGGGVPAPMGFDDLTQRMGKRHGVSPKLLADPTALARKSERNDHWMMVFAGIVLAGTVVALANGLTAAGWSLPAESGALVFAGGFVSVRGAQGLLKLRRIERGGARRRAKRSSGRASQAGARGDYSE